MTDHAIGNALGIAAGTLTTAALVPQVLKTWRSRSADDLSLGMLLIFSLGVALWAVYGVLVGAMPVIVSNAVTLVLSLSMLVMKVHYSASA